MRGLIAEHPQWSRRRISENLALLWEWRSASGQLKDMAARTLLLKLLPRGELAHGGSDHRAHPSEQNDDPSIGPQSGVAIPPARELPGGLMREMSRRREELLALAGRLHGIHVASTVLLTFFGVHGNRGTEVMDALGVLPSFSCWLVHDHWKANLRATTARCPKAEMRPGGLPWCWLLPSRRYRGTTRTLARLGRGYRRDIPA